MSTATASRPTSAATTQNASESSTSLDTVIAETDRLRSLTGEAATFLGVKPSVVCNLLRNVWKPSRDQPPLTDAEMFAGISMIARFQLDPIAREVYVTRTKNGLATIVSVDGWIKVVHRCGDYDGHVQDLTFDEKGNVETVTTTIYSKSRKVPTTYIAYWKEYVRVAGPVAGQMPSHMLRHFSFRHAARYFTPLGASVISEDELAAFANSAPEQVKPVSSLDSLADRFTEPLPQESHGAEEEPAATPPDSETQHKQAAAVREGKPAEPAKPAASIDKATAMVRFLDEVANSDMILDVNGIYQRYFGAGQPLEWTDEESEKAIAVRDARIAKLRESRGGSRK